MMAIWCNRIGNKKHNFSDHGALCKDNVPFARFPILSQWALKSHFTSPHHKRPPNKIQFGVIFTGVICLKTKGKRWTVLQNIREEKHVLGLRLIALNLLKAPVISLNNYILFSFEKSPPQGLEWANTLRLQHNISFTKRSSIWYYVLIFTPFPASNTETWLTGQRY